MSVPDLKAEVQAALKGTPYEGYDIEIRRTPDGKPAFVLKNLPVTLTWKFEAEMDAAKRDPESKHPLLNMPSFATDEYILDQREIAKMSIPLSTRLKNFLHSIIAFVKFE